MATSAVKRSLKLRAARPFQVRYEYWFGDSPLNGMVWRITMRVERAPTRAEEMYVTTKLRDGGPLHPHTSLSEALAEARQARLEYRAGEL